MIGGERRRTISHNGRAEGTGDGFFYNQPYQEKMRLINYSINALLLLIVLSRNLNLKFVLYIAALCL